MDCLCSQLKNTKGLEHNRVQQRLLAGNANKCLLFSLVGVGKSSLLLRFADNTFSGKCDVVDRLFYLVKREG